MTDTDKFSERITERLSRHHAESICRQSTLNSEMEKLINLREIFDGEARRVLTSILLPRIRTLAHHFDNAEVVETSGQSFSCACHFAHNDLFPATVTLSLVIEPGENYAKVKICQIMGILPEFIDYERHGDLQVLLGKSSDDEVGNWVEERLLRFLDVYLQLKTHPIYQKGNLVSDPVCGMTFPRAEAAGSIKHGSREIYFCSPACRDVYLKENDRGSAPRQRL